METIKLTVEFASQALTEIPNGYIDKTVCGCGMSSVALENAMDTILFVPSQELARNKKAQYPNSRSRNIVFAVMAGVTKDDVDDYVAEMKAMGLPIKIMCVYDSLYKVSHLLPYVHPIVDESDRVLGTCALKVASKKTMKDTDVITLLLDTLSEYKDKVSFISATPVPIEYLPAWVSTIPQIKYEWTNTKKVHPILLRRTYPFKALQNEIIEPLKAKARMTIGNASFSKVIVFMNSVTQIIKVCKAAELSPDEVAIIAGDTITNDLKIRGYSRLTNPKQLPKYTFVTSTGFQGIDLEDSDAISVVVSSTSVAHTMIDMVTDLKQAVSRQRDKYNPNYGKFLFIYDQTVFEDTEEDLMKHISTVEAKVKAGIRIWESVRGTDTEVGFMYDVDFLSYSTYIQAKDTFEFNALRFEADKYFILNTRRQYERGFDITNVYAESDIVDKPTVASKLKYTELVEMYNTGMKMEDIPYVHEDTELMEATLRLYGKVWADKYYARKMVDNYGDEYAHIVLTIQSTFNVGATYQASYVKNKLQELYKEFNLSRKAKATDLSEFLTCDYKVVFKDNRSSRVVVVKSKVITKK